MEMVSGFVKTWSPASGGVIAYNHDGSVVAGWDSCLTDGVIYLSSPAIGDIDQDLNLEVVMGFVSSPSGNQVIAYEHNGNLVNGFPVRLDEYVTGISLGNIDQTGGLEIGAGSVGGYFLIANNGTILFRQRFEGGLLSEPLIGDIDGDGRYDFVVSSFGPYLYAYNWQHNLLNHFPIRVDDGTFSCPIVCDINRDRSVDIANAFLDAHFYSWGLRGHYDARLLEWPTNRHDIYRTGNYHIRPAQSKIDEEIIGSINNKYEGLLNIMPNPVTREVAITFILNRKSLVEIEIYDVSGRRLFYTRLIGGLGRQRIIFNRGLFTSGIYFCHFTNQGKTAIKKFVYINN